jgi:hypothetical protein
MKALLIKSPHIEKILAGTKVWEIRGSRTHLRGKIALIQSGTGLIIGTAELVDCKGPLKKSDFVKNHRKLGVTKVSASSGSSYERPHAWVLKNAKKLRKPISYKHPAGAIIWVDLERLGIRF